MSEAISYWIAAREAWITSRSRVSLDRLNFATDLLYVTFMEDFPNPRVAGDAFFKFHRILAEQQDKGNPRRKKFHPIPMTVGQA